MTAEPTELTPAERRLRASHAALISWAKTDDPTERTRPAREAANARFEREADPDGTLDPAERIRRADLLRRAYFRDLARKSAKARRIRRGIGAEATA